MSDAVNFSASVNPKPGNKLLVLAPKPMVQYPASRVGLEQSPSTLPTFHISICRLCKPTLPGFDTPSEVRRPETWTGFQASSAL